MVDGKLDVLGEQVELPAAGALQHLPAEEEACAGHGAAGAQKHPGVVQVAGLPDKPQGVPGGDPVVPVVLGVAVAGEDLIPVAEGLVHGLHEAAVQHVVRVKNQKPVEGPGVVLLNVQEQLLQGVPLAHQVLVEPGVYHRSLGPGDLRCPVSAVIRHDEGGDEALVIGLLADALQQIRDDRLFVPGADEDGEPVGCDRLMGFLFFCERYR